MIRLSSKTDLSDAFRKYLIHGQQYSSFPASKLRDLFKKLSDDVTAGVCVNVATGELSWWSIPLTRVYATDASKVEEYFRVRDKKAMAYRKLKVPTQEAEIMQLLMMILTSGRQ